MILAGGFGTRLRSVLTDIPKPMAPVLGRPFLEWVVRFLAAEGLRKVRISTGYLADKVAGHFNKQPVPGVSLQCVVEQEPLGTAGGFLNAMGAPGETPEAWLVLNGDSLAYASFTEMVSLLDRSETQGVILGVAMDDVSRYGTIVRNPLGELERFEEKRPGAGLINAGVYLFRSSITGRFPKQRSLSFETAVFPELLAENVRLQVLETAGPFLDIGTPESLEVAEAFIQDNLDRFECE